MDSIIVRWAYQGTLRPNSFPLVQQNHLAAHTIEHSISFLFARLTFSLPFTLLGTQIGTGKKSGQTNGSILPYGVPPPSVLAT